MKRTAKWVVCAILAANLAACAGMSERDRDTVVGAGVGTAIGAGVTGDVGGAAVGGVVGGVIGNQVGRH
ncbi:MAG TPA: glycine zipper domain-containing protein [Casimicrobiaceae bacterium]|nr:glycine zipper domain-containing protein [Casimicrobiaceae bacterium]